MIVIVGYINIVCHEGDNCYIECNTANACMVVNVKCNGNCKFECRTAEPTYNCPNGSIGNSPIQK